MVELIATFHLSSAASSNLGWSQNGVLRNGLKTEITFEMGRKHIVGMETWNIAQSMK